MYYSRDSDLMAIISRGLDNICLKHDQMETESVLNMSWSRASCRQHNNQEDTRETNDSQQE